jgi:GH3 auxin-responsive promoter
VIDEKLKILNDDYEVERRHALKAVEVEVLPEDMFMNFMNAKGKVGAQHKFPRVLKGKGLEEWQAFLQQEKIR